MGTLLLLVFIVCKIQENYICMVSHGLKNTITKVVVQCQDSMKDVSDLFLTMHFIIYSLRVLFTSNSLRNLMRIVLLWSILFRKKSELIARCIRNSCCSFSTSYSYLFSFLHLAKSSFAANIGTVLHIFQVQI